jgi:hypothetical protein
LCPCLDVGDLLTGLSLLAVTREVPINESGSNRATGENRSAKKHSAVEIQFLVGNLAASDVFGLFDQHNSYDSSMPL